MSVSGMSTLDKETKSWCYIDFVSNFSEEKTSISVEHLTDTNSSAQIYRDKQETRVGKFWPF